MPVPSRGPFAHAARTVAMTIAAMAIAGGCAPVYYPNISHVPLFSAAGELHASASVTTDGYELMGAVSPLEHLGMMGSYAWGKSMADPTIPPDDHRYYELGLCYYTTIAATRPQRLEVLAGYGAGEARSFERQVSFAAVDPTYLFARSRYGRAFVQGGMGSAFQVPLVDAWGEAGGAVRVARVGFTELSVGDEQYDGLAKLFVEPSLFVRVGHPIVSAELQLGYSYNASLAAPFDYRTLYASIGAHVRIGAPAAEMESRR